MKKYFFILAIVLALPLLPARPAEAIVSQTPDTVGITEETYELLRSFHNESCTTTGGDGHEACPQVLLDLAGLPLMRVFHHGEMYRLTTAGSGLLDITLDRYLPDGFYRNDSGFWWVANGYKLRMKRGEAYGTIVDRAVNDYPSRTPLSEADFAYFLDDCAEIKNFPGSYIWLTFWQSECEKGKVVGHMNSDRFFGKMVLRVEANGELYWVNNKNNLTYDLVTEIRKRVGSHSLFFFIQQNSTRVANGAINKMQSYPLTFPPTY